MNRTIDAICDEILALDKDVKKDPNMSAFHRNGVFEDIRDLAVELSGYVLKALDALDQIRAGE